MDDVTEDPPSPWDRALRIFREWVVPLMAVAFAVQVIGMLRAPSLPDQAPDFTLPALDGKQVSLSDYQGQMVVLNFWATWCGPCRAEIPSFNRFARNNPDIPVLGISADDDLRVLKRESRRMGIQYPVLHGDRETIARYQVTTFPTTVVVGPEGEVLTAHTGIMLPPQLSFATRQSGRW